MDTATVLINAEFSTSLCWQMYYNFAADITAGYLALWRILELILVYGGVFTVIYCIERHLRKDIYELQISLLKTEMDTRRLVEILDTNPLENA